ncbi:MAG: MucBP domain-containing protein, partial [Brevundimonas sp.]
DGTTTVTYVYKPVVAPKPADVTVRYVDEHGKPLADPTSQTGKPGDPYSTAPKVIDGYELVAVPANADGVFTDDTPDVVYVYRPITPVPTPTPTPTTPTPNPTTPPSSGHASVKRPTTKAPAGAGTTTTRHHLAMTGSSAVQLLALGSSLVLGGVVLTAARRRARHDG